MGAGCFPHQDANDLTLYSQLTFFATAIMMKKMNDNKSSIHSGIFPFFIQTSVFLFTSQTDTDIFATSSYQVDALSNEESPPGHTLLKAPLSLTLLPAVGKSRVIIPRNPKFSSEDVKRGLCVLRLQSRHCTDSGNVTCLFIYVTEVKLLIINSCSEISSLVFTLYIFEGLAADRHSTILSNESLRFFVCC